METKQFYRQTLHTAKKINLLNKLGGKCSTCGETRHWMLEFHHTGDKEFDIGENKNLRITVIEKEISKCICLCRNCHRELHHKINNSLYSKVKIKMLEYKNTNCCFKCGYSKNNSALDFHHIDPNTKKFELSSFSNYTVNLPKRVTDELDKCIVLCSNCHREEHYDLKFYEDNKEYILEKSKHIKEIQPALDKEEVKRLYESGMKMIEIARMFNAAKGTISGILKSFGISCSKTILSNIKELKELGYTKKQIHKHLKISNGAVEKYYDLA
jgi:ribosomal protein L30E/predicted transcriptional regulator